MTLGYRTAGVTTAIDGYPIGFSCLFETIKVRIQLSNLHHSSPYLRSLLTDIQGRTGSGTYRLTSKLGALPRLGGGSTTLAISGPMLRMFVGMGQSMGQSNEHFQSHETVSPVARIATIQQRMEGKQYRIENDSIFRQPKTNFSYPSAHLFIGESCSPPSDRKRCFGVVRF